MINIIKLKGLLSCLFLILLLTSAIIFFYNISSTTIAGLIKGDDYIYYDPKLIPVFFLIPAMIVGDLFFICLILPCRKKAVIIMQKIMIPVTVYGIIALFVGFLLSLLISVYPLSTNYYQCKSTSVISSGSYYARSKEICKQRAYSPTTDKEKLSGTQENDGAGATAP